MTSKKISVCALLDSNAANQIENLQHKLHRIKPSGHITIATYESIDPGLVLKYTEAFCKGQPKIDITYNGIGIMAGKGAFIYAIPKVTFELTKLHYDFHQKYDDKATGYTSLNPNTWNPHTSLCPYSMSKMKKCVRNFESIAGNIIGMKVVDVNDRWNVIGEFEFEG